MNGAEPVRSRRRVRARRPPAAPDFAARTVIAALVLAGTPTSLRADESGTGFWQPGAYDDLAAEPNSPGWSLSVTPYHSSAFAGSNVTAARLVRIGALSGSAVGELSATSADYQNIFTLAPAYGFSVPELGAQAAMSLSAVVGKDSSTETGALAGVLGPRGLAASLDLGDSIAGFGDLAPQATLFWSRGVDNFMVYVTGNAPVGAYSRTRLANLGIGHGAVDAGGGYTYHNQGAGLEFSAVAGFTYNFSNPLTSYRSGVDFHLELGASKYLSGSLAVGPVAYLYDEIGCDSGSGDQFGCFRSRVAGLGARVGYSFALGGAQVSVGVKGYGEFAAENRPAGWNARMALSISPK